MSTTDALSAPSLAQLQQQFNARLPEMYRAIGYHLRRLPRRDRDEFKTDVLAACWHAWAGIANRGRDPVNVGPAGILTNAVRYVLAGRRLGTGTTGHGAADVFSRMARKDGGLALYSLDEPAGHEPSARAVFWRDLLTNNNRFSPADEAAFAMDFEAWVAGLSPRKREMAELLLEGHETGVVAKLLRVSPAAVSLTRNWLETSWRVFQGEKPPVAPTRRQRRNDPGQKRAAPLSGYSV